MDFPISFRMAFVDVSHSCLCSTGRGGQGLVKEGRCPTAIYSCLCAKLSAWKLFFWRSAYPLHLLSSASGLNPFGFARWVLPRPPHCRGSSRQLILWLVVRKFKSEFLQCLISNRENPHRWLWKGRKRGVPWLLRCLEDRYTQHPARALRWQKSEGVQRSLAVECPTCPAPLPSPQHPKMLQRRVALKARAGTHQPKGRPGARKPVCSHICTLSSDPSQWPFPPGALYSGSTSKC